MIPFLKVHFKLRHFLLVISGRFVNKGVIVKILGRKSSVVK